MREPSWSVLNLAAYKFVAIEDAAQLRAQWQALCDELGLRGTILIAAEGVNVFLAGAPASARAFIAHVREDARFADLAPKESWSDEVPFRRMRVKVKPEIITMRRPVRPAAGRAPAVDAVTLRRWLDSGRDDEGREVVLLDTRNAFEVVAGTFAGAVDLALAKFSEFPAALAARAGELGDKTVVSFCTGGIRCEKAALVMREEGVPRALQLEGGILKYLEEVGGAHWRGACVVFDQRGALDEALRPTGRAP